VMAIAFDAHPQRPAAPGGLRCHARPAIALEKALFELCQMRPAELRRHQDLPSRDRLRRYEDVRTLADHSAFFGQPRHVPELAFLWGSGEVARLDELDAPVSAAGEPLPKASASDGAGDGAVAAAEGDLESGLARCVAGLVARGYRVAYADLTTPDVAPLGLSVVRAFITGFQPVHFGHGNERLGGRRLFELPYQLGLAPAPRTAADLNGCPHPLA